MGIIVWIVYSAFISFLFIIYLFLLYFIIRECHQKMEFELAECQRELEVMKREQERVVKEHEEAHNVIKVRLQF